MSYFLFGEVSTEHIAGVQLPTQTFRTRQYADAGNVVRMDIGPGQHDNVREFISIVLQSGLHLHETDMGVDFYSTLGGPLIEAPKAPRG